MNADVSKIICEVVLVTPSLASEWLKQNVANRPLDEALVQRYADTMKSGKWLLNGKTIVFDEDGLMRNGQHRCHAAILAQVSFPSVVVKNLSRDAFSNLGEN